MVLAVGEVFCAFLQEAILPIDGTVRGWLTSLESASAPKALAEQLQQAFVGLPTMLGEVPDRALLDSATHLDLVTWLCPADQGECVAINCECAPAGAWSDL